MRTHSEAGCSVPALTVIMCFHRRWQQWWSQSEAEELLLCTKLGLISCPPPPLFCFSHIHIHTLSISTCGTGGWFPLTHVSVTRRVPLLGITCNDSAVATADMMTMKTIPSRRLSVGLNGCENIPLILIMITSNA